MSAMAVGGIVFACVFGGALLGMVLRRALPAHHLSTDSKDVVKLGMGLVGTMAALALGLLLASAKSAYDAQADELRQMSATVLLLDRESITFLGVKKRLADLPLSPMTCLWLLAEALRPPQDLLRLPFTSDQAEEAHLFVTLLLRPRPHTSAANCRDGPPEKSLCLRCSTDRYIPSGSQDCKTGAGIPPAPRDPHRGRDSTPVRKTKRLAACGWYCVEGELWQREPQRIRRRLFGMHRLLKSFRPWTLQS